MGALSVASERAQDRAQDRGKIQPFRLDWEVLLARHPAFSCLSQTETRELLLGSRELCVSGGREVVRQGDEGDSCFLVGSGAVRVELAVPGGDALALGTLRQGEVFGEMSVLDRRPRAASVSAVHDSVLLEIDGAFLRGTIVSHPDLELALLVALTDKLRTTNERLLALDPRATEESVRLLDARISAEVRVFDATLKAAHAVFEQTKVRSDELIASAERDRSRRLALTTVAGTVFMVLGALGAKETLNVSQLAGQMREARGEVDARLKEVKDLEAETGKALAGLREAETAAGRARQIVVQTQLVPAITAAVRSGVESDATETARALARLSAFEENADLLPRLLNETELAILAGGRVEPPAPPRPNPNFTALLGLMLGHADEPRGRARSYALLLINAAIADCGQAAIERDGGESSWAEVLGEFESFAREHRGERLLGRDEFHDLVSRFDGSCPAKRERLLGVMNLIRGG
jgi:CRP/FNR family transcriptional regulator